MKLDTIIKLGSLAFGVVQDDKVKELVGMAHKGAKRRGLFNPPQVQPPTHPHHSHRSGYTRQPWSR